MEDYELVDLQLYKEEVAKNAVCYYLSAIYRYENDSGVYEVHIPKIELPIRDVAMRTPIHSKYIYYENPTIDIGFGDMRMFPDAEGGMIYERLIEEKIHDMTLDEIEKKLGYKVRVVSEK